MPVKKCFETIFSVPKTLNFVGLFSLLFFFDQDILFLYRSD